MSTFTEVAVGDRIKFTPGRAHRWWTVRARDERFIVATCQAPFQPKGELWYTIVDLTGWQNRMYNGAGNGVVRSSLNTLGGGWSIGPDGEGCDEILTGLQAGEWDLSPRRVVDVTAIERQALEAAI